jgi:hypothetical protein
MIDRTQEQKQREVVIKSLQGYLAQMRNKVVEQEQREGMKRWDEDLPTAPLRRRISDDGYDYGWCHGIILTVALLPEPCDEPAGPVPIHRRQ